MSTLRNDWSPRESTREDTLDPRNLCRTVSDIPLHLRAMLRLGFPKRAFSIASPAKPDEKKIDFFYCHCKVHGYYQTYLQGRGWLECPICIQDRLGAF